MNKKYSNHAIAAVTGTKEWAAKTINCCTGCSNNCRYCYARSIGLRFGWTSYQDWGNCHVRPADVAKKHRKYDGRVMFPSSHDMTPENFQPCHTVLGNLLEAGNEVLVVSKPYLESIESICSDFADYRDNIIFRFTIGACDNTILSFWEPGAPSYEERKASLKYAYESGFETSVSAEPMLDTEHVDQLVGDLSPYLTNSLWLGKMNYMHSIRIDGPEVITQIERIKDGQTDDRIKEIYNRHKDTPLIRWKDSIKKVVGIKQAEMPGMDK
jgi:DNA repair photolyase